MKKILIKNYTMYNNNYNNAPGHLNTHQQAYMMDHSNIPANTSARLTPPPSYFAARRTEETIRRDNSLITSLQRNPGVKNVAATFVLYAQLHEISKVHINYFMNVVSSKRHVQLLNWDVKISVLDGIIAHIYESLNLISLSERPRFFAMFYKLCDKISLNHKIKKIDRSKALFEELCEECLVSKDSVQIEIVKHLARRASDHSRPNIPSGILTPNQSPRESVDEPHFPLNIQTERDDVNPTTSNGKRHIDYSESNNECDIKKQRLITKTSETSIPSSSFTPPIIENAERTIAVPEENILPPTEIAQILDNFLEENLDESNLLTNRIRHDIVQNSDSDNSVSDSARNESNQVETTMPASHSHVEEENNDYSLATTSNINSINTTILNENENEQLVAAGGKDLAEDPDNYDGSINGNSRFYNSNDDEDDDDCLFVDDGSQRTADYHVPTDQSSDERDEKKHIPQLTSYYVSLC